MTAFPRDEMEEMVDRWVAANDEAGRTGDWSKMPGPPNYKRFICSSR